jgi:hypothetical protein
VRTTQCTQNPLLPRQTFTPEALCARHGARLARLESTSAAASGGLDARTEGRQIAPRVGALRRVKHCMEKMVVVMTHCDVKESHEAYHIL